MSDKLCKRVISGSKQQELTMQEVLGGLEEIATMLSYDPWPGDFEIIAIYPPNEEVNLPQEQEIVVVSKKKNEMLRQQAEIISYQQQKARRKSA